MELIEKHHLSDTIGNDIIKFFNNNSLRKDAPLPVNTRNGRGFINSMNISSFDYQKTPVLRYKETIYHLYHRPIFDAIKELLLTNDILDNCVFGLKLDYNENNDRIFSEQYSGNWWKKVQTQLPNDTLILSIILYSDATTLDVLSKSTKHPVFLSLGNIPIHRRNKSDAKVLLGYLPLIKASTNSEKRSPQFILAKHHLFQESYRHLTKDILTLQKKGFYLRTDHGPEIVYPFISQIIGDLPENASMCSTFNSALAKYPCHTCLVTRDELNKIHLDITIRTPQMTQRLIENNKAQEFSIRKMNNIFWNFK